VGLYESPVNGDFTTATKEYRVVHLPGVRVRSAPSGIADPTGGVLRAGSVVEGSAVSSAGWVALVGGQVYVFAYRSLSLSLSLSLSIYIYIYIYVYIYIYR